MSNKKLALILACSAAAGLMTSCSEVENTECKPICNGLRNVTCNEQGEQVVEVCPKGCNAEGTGCLVDVVQCDKDGVKFDEGQKVCASGTQISECKNGQWIPENTACSGNKPVCLNGECVAADVEKECTPGAVECKADADNANVDTLFTCSADGVWAKEACGEDEVCGTDGDKAACVDAEGSNGCTISEGGVVVEYEEGNVVCSADGEVIKCVEGEWLPEETQCEGETPVCLNGVCVACNDGDSKCVAALDNSTGSYTHTLFTCDRNAWNEGEACPEGTVCDIETPSKACKKKSEMLSCAEGAKHCQSIYGETWLAVCVSGSIDDENSSNCSADKLICNEDLQSCDDPAAGCGAADACNADVLASADSCRAKYQDSAASGDIKCTEDCSAIDYSACLYCGDGTITAAQGEKCDGSNIGNATCADLDSSKTWKAGGVPACEACQLTVGTCEEEVVVPDTGYTTIRSIKDDFDAFVAKNGKNSVDIAGVVTAVATDNKAFVMQDADGIADAAGVYVYCKTTCSPKVAVGNNVTVTSNSQPLVYSSILEVVDPVVKVVMASAVATPVVKTISELLANGPKNAYESMLVTVKGVKVDELLVKNGKLYDVTLTDGSQKIYVASKFNNDSLSWFSKDFKYDVTGTLYVANRAPANSSEKADLTHLGIRVKNDIVAVGCVDSSKSFVAADNKNDAKCVSSGEDLNKCSEGTDTYRCLNGEHQKCIGNQWKADPCTGADTNGIYACSGSSECVLTGCKNNYEDYKGKCVAKCGSNQHRNDSGVCENDCTEEDKFDKCSDSTHKVMSHVNKDCSETKKTVACGANEICSATDKGCKKVETQVLCDGGASVGTERCANGAMEKCTLASNGTSASWVKGATCPNGCNTAKTACEAVTTCKNYKDGAEYNTIPVDTLGCTREGKWFICGDDAAAACDDGQYCNPDAGTNDDNICLDYCEEGQVYKNGKCEPIQCENYKGGVFYKMISYETNGCTKDGKYFICGLDETASCEGGAVCNPDAGKDGENCICQDGYTYKGGKCEPNETTCKNYKNGVEYNTISADTFGCNKDGKYFLCGDDSAPAVCDDGLHCNPDAGADGEICICKVDKDCPDVDGYAGKCDSDGSCNVYYDRCAEGYVYQYYYNCVKL